MSRVFKSFLSLPLAFGVPLLAHAQSLSGGSEDSDYSDYFGEEESADTGPQSLEEAQREGRGYRVGRGSRPTGAAAPDVYTVREGDTLWSITGHYLGDSWQWPQVWSYNPEITNPHWIYPSSNIRLTAPLSAPGTEPTVAAAGAAPGTEEALNVVVPLSEFKPGTVFLRDQGYLDDDSLKAAGTVVGAPEERMVLSVTDEIYIKFGDDVDVRAGQQFAIFRQVNRDERLPGEQGALVRIFGTVMIRSFDQERHVARGVITEGLDAIERGYRVAQVERRFDFVPPRRNAKDLVAKIIATVQQRDLISEGVVVFLNVGEEEGVEAGNRFFVIRRGDEWRDSLRTSPTNMGSIVPGPRYRPEEYPDEVVAELRVIKVRKNVSIAIVTRSNYDIGMGERAEMREGF